MQDMNSLSLVMILGAAQGFFLAALLLARSANSLANRILALTMISFSLFILSGAYYARDWYLAFPHVIGYSEPLVYTFGPLLYLYALTLSRGSSKFRKVWLFHFMPFALVALYLVPFFAQGADTKIAFLERILAGDTPTDVRLIELLKYPHGFIYTFWTLRLVQRYGVQLKQDRSSIEHINLRWLRNLMFSGLGIWILSMIGGLAPILLALFIYTMGYLGLRQPEIFHPQSMERAGTSLQPNAVSTVPTVEPSRYRKSGLDPDAAVAHAEALLSFMDKERPYLQSDLTLQELAAMLQLRPHHLSQVINTRCGKSFYDFVNAYRVEEVKRRLADPGFASLTILAIAVDSGFKSKSSFNEIFKKQVGMTPSDFRRQVQTNPS